MKGLPSPSPTNNTPRPVPTATKGERSRSAAGLPIGTTTTLANGSITVPARYWKVLLILPNDDAPDIPRITPDTRVIAEAHSST